MKLSNLKPVLSVILAFALLLAVSACGNRNIPAPSVSPGASATAPVEQAPTAETYEGEYTMFAVSSEGYTVQSDGMDMTSVMTLKEDGTGVMTMDDETIGIAEWKVDDDGTLTVTVDDGSSTSGLIHDGIAELDIWGNGGYILLYDKEGADISAYEVLTMEEFMAKYEADQAASAPDSLTYAAFKKLDAKTGVHLSYQVQIDSKNSTSEYDVQGQGGAFYSVCTTRVSGYEDTTVSLFLDGVMYRLLPEDHTASVVTATSSSAFKDEALILDDLYAALRTRAEETEFKVETREVDGVSYQAEVFPGDDYLPEAAFYFDRQGELAYYWEDEPVSMPELGEAFYTIHFINDAVDETLFDLSAYEIVEKD